MNTGRVIGGFQGFTWEFVGVSDERSGFCDEKVTALGRFVPPTASRFRDVANEDAFGSFCLEPAFLFEDFLSGKEAHKGARRYHATVEGAMFVSPCLR